MRELRVIALLLLGGCAGGAASGPLVPGMPTVDAGCRLGATQNSVIVTEWPSPDKANLQAMLGGGGIAVAFSGCEMRLLPQCKLGGQYQWQRTTLANDRIEINNEAELYAKLPLGAFSLGGELKKSGELAVETTVSGQARLLGMEAAQVTADPACADATHIVNAISIGAFTLTAGGAEGTQANAAYGVGSANGKLAQSAKLVRAAGDKATCSSSTDQGPALDCASPIQAFLTRIPGRGEPEVPVGKVAVDFVSASATTRWDVYVDDKATCTTPCSTIVDPSHPIALRTREDQQRLSVDHILTGVGPVQIAAKPRNQGKFVTGISLLGVGAMTAFTGGFLMLAGSAGDREGLSTAGKYTLGSTIVFAPIGLYLLLTSGARIEQHSRYGAHGAVITF